MDNLTKKVLHVIDDKKFIKYCEKTFDLKNIDNYYSDSNNFKSKVLTRDFDFIVIHYLDFKKARVLNTINTKATLIWFFWGRDAFILGKFYTQFLQTKTKKIFIQLAFRRSLFQGLKVIFKFLAPTLADCFSNNREIIKAFKKIHVIVPVMPKDFYLLKQKYVIKSKMFHLNYVNPSFNDKKVIKGNNILLGNSASYSNNHIEILDMLSQQKLSNRKVIIPLNYGDNQYANYIENYGSKRLKTNVTCLRNFIPLPEYINLIETCSIVIMNHDRQQAVGNIVPLLAMGAHIYLSEKSSLYQFLQKKRFCISKIQPTTIFKELNKEQIIKNKKLAFKYFSKEVQHKKVIQLLEILN